MDLTGIISNLSEGHLTAGGAIILALTVALSVVRGFIRALLGGVGFIAAIIAFWFVFKNAGGLLTSFTDNPEPWMPLGIAGGGAVAAYTAVRHGAGFILKPLIGSIDELKKHRVISGLVGLGIGGAGLYGGGSASHQFDTMKFLQDVSHEEEGGWVTKLLTKTQESWFGDIQQSTDPTKTAYRCDLIKALSIYTSGQVTKYQHPSFQALIESSDFRKLAASPEIAKGLGNTDFRTLFQNAEIKEFTKTATNRELIDMIDWKAIQ